MLLKKIAYWGAGFACSIVIIVGFLVASKLSSPAYKTKIQLKKSKIKVQLHWMYMACEDYWVATNPANTCKVDILDSQTTYNYIQSPNIIIWGESGGKSNFSVKGGSREVDSVYNLESHSVVTESNGTQIDVTFRELQDEELESALIEMNKLKGNNKAP